MTQQMGAPDRSAARLLLADDRIGVMCHCQLCAYEMLHGLIHLADRVGVGRPLRTGIFELHGKLAIDRSGDLRAGGLGKPQCSRRQGSGLRGRQWAGWCWQSDFHRMLLAAKLPCYMQ